jgi:hypothetical protein
MRKEIAETLSLRNRIGDDWHFVASLSYAGKVKHLDYVGYHKRLGGTSKTFRHFASTIGASQFAARFPHLRIAMDAFSEIFFHSPIYKGMPGISKFMLALFSFVGILTNYYFKIFPFIAGGKIKRTLIKMNKQWSPMTA